MIRFVRTRFRLVCLMCFALTTGAGVLGLLQPGIIDTMMGTTIDITDQSRFFFQTAFLLIAIVGVWFLIIMVDPHANRPLLVLATAEKFAFVAFFIWSIMNQDLGLLSIPVILGDLLMGLACLIYLVLGDIQPHHDAVD